MFQFPAFASGINRMTPRQGAGLPHSDIRGSTGAAPPRGFSQLAASFIASGSLGIRHAPFSLSDGTGISRRLYPDVRAIPLNREEQRRPFPLHCHNMSQIYFRYKTREWRITDSNR